MTGTSVHVFAGRFRDRDEASAYADEQHDPTPVLLMTEEECRASQERYPYWPLCIDLGIERLDHDYMEIIHDLDGLNRYDYLQAMLRNPADIARIRQLAGPEANILVLIFKGALGGLEVTMRSTPRLSYCGEFPSTI